jgi:hypothetical protein
VRAFEASAALSIYRAVMVGSNGKVSYATSATDYIGTLEQASFADGDFVGVRLRSGSGTRKMVASTAITAGNPVYLAADGKVAATGNTARGYALETASGDGAVIEVLTLELPDNWIPAGAVQSLSGAGACNVTSFLTKVTTTGANALTLANGTRVGQLKKIQMIVDGGDGTLTPTSASGFTTITFNDIGDYALLKWNGTAWILVEQGNDADGATGPTVA